MKLLQKLSYSENWNIGFCNLTPSGLLDKMELPQITWLKHPYHDRWFADPFIYKVTDDEIIVFVEECPMVNPKGILCELVIDRKTIRLKERYELLSLDTHLSYPIYKIINGKTFVYPENGVSGMLNAYEYDEKHHRLINPRAILNEAVADATIVNIAGNNIMTATIFPDTLKVAHLYHAVDTLNIYTRISKKPIVDNLQYARNGGDYFHVNKCTYRPAQDCVKDYGSGLSIMKVKYEANVYSETLQFSLYPKSYRYHRGLHTLNFHKNLCVIDGYGYSYPTIGRCIALLKNLLRKIK